MKRRVFRRNSGETDGSLARARLNSFTLVEVVLAIAITSFVLISILGLMAYASQMVQVSDRNARLASVTSQVLATIGSESYSAIRKQGLTTNITYYFTSEGIPTNSTAASAYYKCVATNATPTPLVTDGGGTQLLELIQISILWPRPFYTSSNIVVTATANYD